MEKIPTNLTVIARAPFTVYYEGPASAVSAKNRVGPFDILPGKCVDGDLIARLFNVQVKAGKDRSQRRECGCLQSKDIGFYDTCLHGCAYCYAGTLQSGLRNRVKHEVDSPLLIGNI